MNLKNSVALIFGASDGIGLCTAKQLLKEGMLVYNASRTPCAAEGVKNIVCDAFVKNDILNAVQVVIDDCNRLDALIYSAGTSMAAPLEHVKDEDLRYLFEVNFFGSIHAAQGALPFMRQNGGGRIILIGSVGGTIPIAFDAPYSCSKAALDMLSRELNIEVNPYNVFVTAVLPGGTATNFTFKRKVYSQEDAGVYAACMNKAVVSLADIEQGGMAPSLVAESILKTLKAAHPSPVVTAGITNKAYTLFSKVLPLRLTQMINQNVYKQ